MLFFAKEKHLRFFAMKLKICFMFYRKALDVSHLSLASCHVFDETHITFCHFKRTFHATLSCILLFDEIFCTKLKGMQRKIHHFNL
jgi:hypothetical protein